MTEEPVEEIRQGVLSTDERRFSQRGSAAVFRIRVYPRHPRIISTGWQETKAD
jgi:hypothetical protein